MPLLTAMLTFLLSAAPVLAQNATKAPAPKAMMSKPWFLILVAFFLMALVDVGSFLSPKRNNQD